MARHSAGCNEISLRISPAAPSESNGSLDWGVAGIQFANACGRAAQLYAAWPPTSDGVAPRICREQLERPMVSLNARGFALLVVLWVAAMLSAVSLALIASSRAEARNTAGDWDRLAGERLARSGQQFALYLGSRGLGGANENLSGLPVDAQIPGFRYTLRFPEGSVGLFLESDGGKINPLAADTQVLQNFLTRWTGDSASGMLITDAIKDWRKQNNRVGVADLPLIKGLSFNDFQPTIVTDSSAPAVRESIDEFLASASGSEQINPNFAPRLVLLSIPGLAADQVDALLQVRRQGAFFANADELRSRVAIPADSAVWQYFRFDRGLTPSVLTVTDQGSDRRQSE